MCTCFSVLPLLLLRPFFFCRPSVCGAICVSCLLSFGCKFWKHLALYPLFSFFLNLLLLSEQTQISHLSWYAMHSTPLPLGSFQSVHIRQTEEVRAGPSTPDVSPGLRRQDCHLPQSASCTLDSTAQDVVCFLCALLTHAQFVIHWDTQAFFCKVLYSQSPTTL